jgi:hypothetical protein
MHTYPLSVLRRQMRDSRSPADLRHIERGTWHENAFVTRAEPPICTLVVIGGQAGEGVPKDRSVRSITWSCHR